MKKILSEISFIRPILIVLLVTYHAFAPFSDAWSHPVGFAESTAYRWLDYVVYSIMLESFVFISGYVYAYQIIVLGKKYSLVGLVKKKFIRLIIPCLLFGILYQCLFSKNDNLKESFILLLSGTGHLWFLPMLFWCFLELWILLKINTSNVVRSVIVLFLVFIANIGFPLQISQSLFYLPFFYMGYIFYSKNSCFREHATLSTIICLWVTFIVAFVLFKNAKLCIDTLFENHIGLSTIERSGLLATRLLLKYTYPTVGLLALYMTSLRYTSCRIINDRVIKFGEYCFGIYIFQQFVLRFLYYYTMIPNIIDSSYLPWLGCLLAMVLSFAFSYAICLTSWGRKII